MVTAQGSGSFPGSLTPNGWTKLPNGFIMQWGTITNNSDALQTYFYPIPFPEACVGVIINRQAVDSAHPFGAINVTTASFGIDRNASVDGINYANWFAIGY